MTTKHSEEYFFTSAVRKRQQTLKWHLDFDWLLRSYDYSILIFLLVYFSGLKYILARKVRHNARQSDNNGSFYCCFCRGKKVADLQMILETSKPASSKMTGGGL